MSATMSALSVDCSLRSARQSASIHTGKTPSGAYSSNFSTSPRFLSVMPSLCQAPISRAVLRPAQDGVAGLRIDDRVVGQPEEPRIVGVAEAAGDEDRPARRHGHQR